MERKQIRSLYTFDKLQIHSAGVFSRLVMNNNNK